jgi:hypothetical protein
VLVEVQGTSWGWAGGVCWSRYRVPARGGQEVCVGQGTGYQLGVVPAGGATPLARQHCIERSERDPDRARRIPC